MWPSDAGALSALQRQLSRRSAEPWTPPPGPLLVGGCWVCFPRGLTGPGQAGDRAWAVAVVLRGVEVVDQNVRLGEAAAPYVPGLLATRIGGVLETAVRGLAVPPEVLLVDATGSDHPRRAGLAIHLGAVLGLPTIGVTHRPLTGEGDWPADRRGATSPVRIGDDVVASWVRTRRWHPTCGRAPGMAGRSGRRRGPRPAGHPTATHSRAAQTGTEPGSSRSRSRGPPECSERIADERAGQPTIDAWMSRRYDADDQGSDPGVEASAKSASV